MTKEAWVAGKTSHWSLQREPAGQIEISGDQSTTIVKPGCWKIRHSSGDLKRSTTYHPRMFILFQSPAKTKPTTTIQEKKTHNTRRKTEGFRLRDSLNSASFLNWPFKQTVWSSTYFDKEARTHSGSLRLNVINPKYFGLCRWTELVFFPFLAVINVFIGAIGGTRGRAGKQKSEQLVPSELMDWWFGPPELWHGGYFARQMQIYGSVVNNREVRLLHQARCWEIMLCNVCVLCVLKQRRRGVGGGPLIEEHVHWSLFFSNFRGG